jgi:transposase-like protein
MSRPGKGVEHVESLEGDATAKARVKVVLETISGQVSVEEACRILAVSPSRFHELRETALSGAIQALSPRPPGRPAAPSEDPVVTALRRENAELRHDLEAARTRAELALAMPQLLRPMAEGEKGGPRRGPGGRSGA